jgi:BlaI family transcriptional regulator, penicillinase repressor
VKQNSLAIYYMCRNTAGMAKRSKPARFASGDLELLEMLWRAGPVTILEAQQALGKEIGYTTVQTRLNRLVEKHAAKRTTTRPAKYSAAVTPEEVRGRDLDVLVQRVSAGRVTPLVAHLLNAHDLSVEELAELKQLVAEAEQKSRNKSNKGKQP